MTTAEAFTRKYTSEEAHAIKEVGYGLHSATPETAKKYLNAGGILALQWNHSNSMYYSEHDETYVPVCVLKLVAFNIEDDTATREYDLRDGGNTIEIDTDVLLLSSAINAEDPEPYKALEDVMLKVAGLTRNDLAGIINHL